MFKNGLVQLGDGVVVGAQMPLKTHQMMGEPLGQFEEIFCVPDEGSELRFDRLPHPFRICGDRRHLRLELCLGMRDRLQLPRELGEEGMGFGKYLIKLSANGCVVQEGGDLVIDEGYDKSLDLHRYDGVHQQQGGHQKKDGQNHGDQFLDEGQFLKPVSDHCHGSSCTRLRSRHEEKIFNMSRSGDTEMDTELSGRFCGFRHRDDAADGSTLPTEQFRCRR